MLVTPLTPLIGYPRPEKPRSPGIHVSGIIRNMAVENHALDPKYLDVLDLHDYSDEAWWAQLPVDAQLRMSMGLAWEAFYLPRVGGVTHQPGEMFLDGIFLTHDGESYLPTLVLSECGQRWERALAVHEVKLTYKSTNTVSDLRKQYQWMAQLKAYCKARGTLLAYLHRLHVVGDYSYPLGPMLRVDKILFTQREIDENWDQITGYVKHRQAQAREDLMRDTYE